MRIDAYNKVSQMYQANKVHTVESAKKTGKSDQLEISQTGKDYQTVKQAVAGAEEVRMDKVEEIKKRLASGTYDVSMSEIADKLLDNYFNTLVQTIFKRKERFSVASLIEELITTLQQENDVYSEMIPIAKEKSSIIANNDLLALQEITDKEQAFVEKVMMLDKKREEIIANVGIVLCKEAKTLKIQEIIKLLEAQPKEQEKLSSVHTNLKKTINELMEFNNHNKSLIEQSLEIIEFNMNFIQSTRMSPGNNYTKSAGQASSVLPEAGMFDAKQQIKDGDTPWEIL